MILNLNEPQKEFALAIAKLFAKKYSIAHYKHKKGHYLYEYNIQNDTIQMICSANDYEQGKVYPILQNNCLYIFKLNEANAIRGITKLLEALIDSANEMIQ